MLDSLPALTKAISKSADSNESSEVKSNYTGLQELLSYIKQQSYSFTAVTPQTHKTFLAKNIVPGATLRDIFGWNMKFKLDTVLPALKHLLLQANIIETTGGNVKSTLRVASLENDLFFHSEFPTTKVDAVFFGPDTYRFARFIRQSLKESMQSNGKNDKELFSSQQDILKPSKSIKILDIGCGTGAGGITVVKSLPVAQDYELVLNDINHLALDLAAVNTANADVRSTFLPGDIFEEIDGEFDIIVSNPPYMSDPEGRAYRDGGSQLGLDFSINIVKLALAHLAPGGQFLLYTGVAMTDDADPLKTILASMICSKEYAWSYEEIDPDIFGEELEQQSYSRAHRIAAVGLRIIRNLH